MSSSSSRRIQHHLSSLSTHISVDVTDATSQQQQSSVHVSQCSSKDSKQQNDAASSSNDVDPPKYPFHLAIPVHDLKLAREFYGGKLGLEEGRSAHHWIDYNLYGHQLVVHLVTKDYRAPDLYNPVDRDYVPVPHFGCALSIPEFHNLVERIRKIGDIKFLVEPHIRFPGQPGEQWTCFFKDPSGNSLEFKAMSNPKNLFARYVVKD